MEKIILNLNNGVIKKNFSPKPILPDGYTYVRNIYSVVSPGTEKMLIKFGDANIFQKIINNSDRVKLLVRKMLEEGFFSTYNKVQNKLNKPVELGYSTCAEVVKTTSKVLNPGDIVVTNAPHSNYSVIKNNLCIKVKKDLNKKNLSFAFLSSIPINAYRISNIKKNEKAAVVGLGLIGLILGKYLINEKINLNSFDIDKVIVNKFNKELNANSINKNFSDLDSKHINSYNVVYLCTENISTSLLYKACEMLKDNGTVIIIGTTKALFPRDIIYKKSLNIKVAVSYGPGRYDDKFEKGIDKNYINKFKYSYLSNIESFINKVCNNSFDLSNLNFSEYNFNSYKEAYLQLKKGTIRGIIFSYDNKKKYTEVISKKLINKIPDKSFINCDIIGTGSHAANKIIPEIIAYDNTKIINLVSKNGISDNFLNDKLNLNANINSIKGLLSNKFKDNYLFILSSHDTHKEFLTIFIKNKKKIFIEKPLCETLSDLAKIKKAINKNYMKLHVNYNRRYSKHSSKIKSYLNNGSINIDYNIYNNSFIKEKKDINSVKSILIGEICHFIDFCQFLINKKVLKHDIYFDNYNIHLRLFFQNSSIANIHYYTIDNNNLSKENITIHNGDNKIVLNNFKDLTIFNKYKKYNFNTRQVDKGFNESLNFFFNDNYTKDNFNQIIENSKITLISFLSIKNDHFS